MGPLRQGSSGAARQDPQSGRGVRAARIARVNAGGRYGVVRRAATGRTGDCAERRGDADARAVAAPRRADPHGRGARAEAERAGGEVVGDTSLRSGCRAYVLTEKTVASRNY